MPVLRIVIEVRLTKKTLRKMTDYQKQTCCDVARNAVQAQVLYDDYLPTDSLISVEARVDPDEDSTVPPAVTNYAGGATI